VKPPGTTAAWEAVDMAGLAAAARALLEAVPGAFAGEAAAKAAVLLALRAYHQQSAGRKPPTAKARRPR
jgi:hypothetical protein